MNQSLRKIVLKGSLLSATALAWSMPSIQVEAAGLELANNREISMPVADLATPFTFSNKETLYLFGGHLGDQHNYHPWNFSDGAWKINLSANPVRWERLPSKPTTSMGSNGVGFYEDKVYLFCGFRNSWTPADGPYNADPRAEINAKYWESSTVVEVFDLKTETWSTLKDVAFPARSSAGVAQIGHKVFFVGGWDAKTGQMFDAVGVFDLQEQKYFETDWKLPSGRRAVVAVAHSDTEIVMAGGLGAETECWKLDVTTGLFTELPRLPFGVTNAQIVSLKGRLFLLGGSFRSEMGSTIFELDPALRRWFQHDVKLHRTKASGRIQKMADDRAVLLGGYVLNGKDDPFIPSIGDRKFGSSPVTDIDFFRLL